MRSNLVFCFLVNLRFFVTPGRKVQFKLGSVTHSEVVKKAKLAQSDTNLSRTQFLLRIQLQLTRFTCFSTIICYWKRLKINTSWNPWNRNYFIDNWIVQLPKHLTHICSGSERHERDTSVTYCHLWDRNYLSLISHIFPGARACSGKRVMDLWRP